MTLTVVLQKQPSGMYTGRVKGNHENDLGANLLTGDRKTKNVDEAKEHCTAKLGMMFETTAGIKPTIQFELAQPVQRKEREARPASS